MHFVDAVPSIPKGCDAASVPVVYSQRLAMEGIELVSTSFLAKLKFFWLIVFK